MAIIKRTIKRPDGTERVRWRARYADGTRRTIERHFMTKREATRWLTEQKASVNRGTHIHPAGANKTLAAVADEWRDTWGRLQPRTKAGYEAILRKHVLPRWGEVPVGAITAAAIQEWVNGLAASGRAPQTVRRIYGVLQSVVKLAVVRRYIAVNPCESVDLPHRHAYANQGHAGRREMLFLTAAEVQLLAEAIDSRYRVLIYTAAYTGMRAGELYGLQRKHVDVLGGRVRVERALKEVNTSSPNIAPEDKGLIFGTTKSGEERSVGLPRFLRDMLAAHLDELPGGPDALVFGGENGKPARHDGFMRRHFKPTVRAALPAEKAGLRFHDLRHTCAALLIAADAHPKAIQAHLGHADIQTTFNVYGHLLPESHDALAQALDATHERANGNLPSNVAELRPK